MRGSLALCMLTLVLAGCDVVSGIGWPKPPPDRAASAAAWGKPGADPADVRTAYDDCLAVANTATDNDFAIDQDIAATRSGDLQRSSFAGAPVRDAQRSSRDRAQAVLSSCMNGKGFTPAR